MTDEAMSVVLTSDHLNIDEMEIIDAIREWATVNSVRSKYLKYIQFITGQLMMLLP